MRQGNGNWQVVGISRPSKWLWLSALIVVADQISKQWIMSQLQIYESKAVIPFLNFTLMYNAGAAFSFLNQAGGWQRWFFIVLAIIVSSVLVVWLYRLPDGRRWFACALSLILGGALGNLWDRLSLGYVVDFIDVYYGPWHWPAFNVADSAITVGAVMLLLDALRRDTEA
jgi:signal peptidase II